MAINDRNHGPRVARNQRAEATWPEHLRHLCKHFEGMKYKDVEKTLFKTPKTQVDLMNDLRMQVIMLGCLTGGPELEADILHLGTTYVQHHQIEDLVYNSTEAYEHIIRRMATMVVFAEEERVFADKFNIELIDDSLQQRAQAPASPLVADGTALLGSVSKDKRQGPPQALSATAGAIAEVAKDASKSH